ncbi:MAG: FG-GAP-like repeat-containing protein [Nitrospira sp.]|nr:VCBS repeat-containing protein [Nitrospira sp.]
MSLLQQRQPSSQDSVPPGTDQSVLAPEKWTHELTKEFGWNEKYPRMIADVNNDKKQDIVGFGIDGVWLATSNGTAFTPALVLLDAFNERTGWRVEKHERLTGDINNDKLDDIVGFGDAGVYRALSTGGGFAPVSPTPVVPDFGYDQGWRVDKHVRLLADVNNDGRKDIVGFGDDGVRLSLATSDGNFSNPVFVLANFGYKQGWRTERHIRTTADVNGDGMQDIVAFGDDGVWLAISTGNGFIEPQQPVLSNFGFRVGSWRVDRHPRMLADVNRDGKQDIVGFGDAGVWLALSIGNGFAEAQFVLADFGYNQGWRVERHPRFMTDLNGDGYMDIIGYGEGAVYRALGGSSGFSAMRSILNISGAAANYYKDDFVLGFIRFVGDVTGDGLSDLISFGSSYITVTRSSTQPPQPEVNAPSYLHITGSTTSSITLEWSDNSNNEDFFTIVGQGDGYSRIYAISRDKTTKTFTSLDQDKQYCFTVWAENRWDLSEKTRQVCGRTTKQQPQQNQGPFTTTIWMQRQQILEGYIPYLGIFGPIYDTGATITNINFPLQFPPVALVRPNHSTIECGDPNAIVLVHGDMTADQKIAIWGTTTLFISGQQTLQFVGCASNNPQFPGDPPVNITWKRP